MYQWYYAKKEKRCSPKLQHNVVDSFQVNAVRATMWEEHCLECAAPECYDTCTNYAPRKDGRCQLFSNSISVFKSPLAIGGRGAHIKFRKWANMLGLVFQNYMTIEECNRATHSYHNKSMLRRFVASSFLSPKSKWDIIHWIERKARKKMRNFKKSDRLEADAFILHCYSYNATSYKLVLEVYEKHNPKFRTSFEINPGENFYIISVDDFSPECWKFNNLVKIYPENNFEADIDFYWCDFVQGGRKENNHPKVKCVVWDLDNTLWDGVISECDDASKPQLREGILDIIKELDSKGILQSIASKNDFEPCFKRLSELGISTFFLYPQINWGPKSNSINIIAQLLNIGLDSIVLFDDSIFEREEVQHINPQVRVYDAADIKSVIKTASFDVPVTQESSVRRKFYIDEFRRKEDMRSSGTSNIDFLAQCKIKIDLIELKTDEVIERCFELVQRTNQLNMSGMKYTRNEFKNVINDFSKQNYAIYCEDQYGAYGVSCYIQYFIDNTAVNITEFAMSCRVAEKCIESALFSYILKKENRKYGRIKVIKTSKNDKLLNLFRTIGFVTITESDKNVEFEFSQELKNNHIVKIKEL